MPRALLVGLLLMCLPAPGWGRSWEVRLLKGNTQSGVWGTDEFQATIDSLGTVRHVCVGGKEFVWQAAALYTSPVPPGEKEGLRTVQGEGFGARGLTVTRPEASAREDHGRRVFEFRHLVANQKVLGGTPLCEVRQKVVLTPGGEIAVSYDCRWLQTLRWTGFSLLVLFDKEAIAGRDYLLLIGDRVLTGQLNPGRPIADSRIRDAFTRLSIWSGSGPFHFAWEGRTTCELTPPQLTIVPIAVPYRAMIYKGVEDRLAYKILLPVSQQ